MKSCETTGATPGANKNHPAGWHLSREPNGGRRPCPTPLVHAVLDPCPRAAEAGPDSVRKFRTANDSLLESVQLRESDYSGPARPRYLERGGLPAEVLATTAQRYPVLFVDNSFFEHTFKAYSQTANGVRAGRARTLRGRWCLLTAFDTNLVKSVAQHIPIGAHRLFRGKNAVHLAVTAKARKWVLTELGAMPVAVGTTEWIVAFHSPRSVWQNAEQMAREVCHALRKRASTV